MTYENKRRGAEARQTAEQKKPVHDFHFPFFIHLGRKSVARNTVLDFDFYRRFLHRPLVWEAYPWVLIWGWLKPPAPVQPYRLAAPPAKTVLATAGQKAWADRANPSVSPGLAGPAQPLPSLSQALFLCFRL